MAKEKKEYRDYGEYLEDAYEEWCDLMEQQEDGRKEQYGIPSNRLTITARKGELKAEWSRRMQK